MIFRCKHKFSNLAVFKESTEVDDKEHPESFKVVTYHLFCQSCGKELDLSHAKMIGGVDAFLKR